MKRPYVIDRFMIMQSSMITETDRAEALERLNASHRKRWDAADKTTFHEVRKHEQSLIYEGDRIRDVLAYADPGTAGDAAEMAWANVIQNFLPEYKVVVKGTLTGVTAGLSPQIDILVVDPSCPAYLIHGKAIPAHLVIAAFECKLTLRLGDLAKVVQTAQILKQERRNRASDPISCVPIFYGLLGLGCAIENRDKLHCHSVLDAIKKHSEMMADSLDMLDAVVVPGKFCLSADPQIFCHDIDRFPHDMCFLRKYLIQGDPQDATPAYSSLGLFLYKLFSYLGRSDKQLMRVGAMYELFVRELLDDKTISETPLDRLVPIEYIDRLAKGGYDGADVCFDLYM